ncbi:MAG: hypothetical protein EOO42_04510 [Flavobacteriales bacterium]|nr:MAG: hypothetical protein EOO42_04510 [Flavobacteriales bacterium]
MKKFPFNNEGFQALQANFYQLSDEELNHEALQIEANFTQWVETNFYLDEKQVSYLGAIDARVQRLLAFNTSFAIANRLPIALNKTENDTKDEQGKIIWPESSLTAISGGADGFTARGSLAINIRYQV